MCSISLVRYVIGVTVWFGWGGVVSLCRLKQCLNTNTKHNKYNRHSTTNPISLSLVTEVKKGKKNISLRMVKN